MPDKDKFLDCQKDIEKDFCICYNAYRQKRCKKSTYEAEEKGVVLIARMVKTEIKDINYVKPFLEKR